MAYEKAIESGPQGNIDLATITPSEFFFNLGTNQLIVSQCWGTHTLPNKATVTLETKMDCYYVQAESVLRANSPMLHITHQDSNQKETVLMHVLHRMYPYTDTLNLNPKNLEKNAMQSTRMVLERVLGIRAGKSRAELPSPTKFRNDLYFEDLKKLVELLLDN